MATEQAWLARESKLGIGHVGILVHNQGEKVASHATGTCAYGLELKRSRQLLSCTLGRLPQSRLTISEASNIRWIRPGRSCMAVHIKQIFMNACAIQE